MLGVPEHGFFIPRKAKICKGSFGRDEKSEDIEKGLTERSALWFI